MITEYAKFLRIWKLTDFSITYLKINESETQYKCLPHQSETSQQWCSWSFVTYSSVQHGLLLENHSSIVLEVSAA